MSDAREAGSDVSVAVVANICVLDADAADDVVNE